MDGQLNDCADALGITRDMDWQHVYSNETKVAMIVDHLNALLQEAEKDGE